MSDDRSHLCSSGRSQAVIPDERSKELIERVYLHAWATGSQGKSGIGRWTTFYNHQRPHAAHHGQPSVGVYRQTITDAEPDQQVQVRA